MNEMILILQEELEEIFPEILTITITPETVLEEIPDWDSMGAINLQVILNENYQLDLSQDYLNDDTSFAELISLIREKAA